MFADVLHAACKLYEDFPLLVFFVVIKGKGRRGRNVSRILTIEPGRGPVCLCVTIRSGRVGWGASFLKNETRVA